MNGAWQRGVLRAGPTARAGPWAVKLGGSLLGRAGWPDLILELEREQAAPVLIIVGGGPVVEGLRAIDAAGPQPPDVMHRLAIDAMGLTARIVAATTRWPVVAEAAGGRETSILDVPAWLSREGRLTSLPAGWHVTSDSIAALAAAACGGRLLLAKSAPPPDAAADLDDLADRGWVDRHFPTAAAGLDAIEWAAPPGPAAGRARSP